MYLLPTTPPVLVKDYGPRNVLVRWLAWRSLRREEKALRRLDGVKGVPRLYRRIGSCALAMEYIDAPSLSDWKKTRDLPPDFATRLKELFEAVERRGVFHGDPHFKNILCGRDGQPYLIDFAFSYVRGAWPLVDGWVIRNLRATRDERLRKIRRVFYDEQPEEDEDSATRPPLTYRILKWFKKRYKRLKRPRRTI